MEDLENLKREIENLKRQNESLSSQVNIQHREERLIQINRESINEAKANPEEGKTLLEVAKKYRDYILSTK